LQIKDFLKDQVQEISDDIKKRMRKKKEHRTPIKVIKMQDITNSINLTIRDKIPDLISRKTIDNLEDAYDDVEN
jgi:hypothetical protein